MVNATSAQGTGQLPDKEDQMYVVTRDDFYLVPTAEVPVTNIFRDEILPEDRLPMKLCASTPCFRREAGSYGKDVRGLNRVHQFNKVELVKMVLPQTSYDELELLRADAERVLQKLGLHYHVLLMCAGDLGFTQTKKYDLEVWSAGQQKWLEVSSISNFESFQARRLNLRYRPKGSGKPEMLHTLNGSALALPRIVAALLEHCQTPEGKVIIPKALQKYTGFELIG
jgi:seryl-tRNA synthetase